MPTEPHASSNHHHNDQFQPHDGFRLWPYHLNMPKDDGSKNPNSNKTGAKDDSSKSPSTGVASARNGGHGGSHSYMGLSEDTQKLVKRYRTEVAASASSVLSTVTTFPLDSIKTRMQTYKYSGVIDCVRQTYRAEKLRGFFRGVTSPIASVTLVRTVSFSIYQRSRNVYCDWLKANFGIDVMGHVSSKGSFPNLWSLATFGVAGATAGSVITVIACPFELTKLSAQVSVLMADKKNTPSPERLAIAASYQNKGTLKTMSTIVKHRGYSGLYTGFNLHLLRDTLGTGIYFMTYESGKQLMSTYGGDGAHSNPLAVLVAGGLCGVVSWALIYPVDSAKSIYQRNSLMFPKGQKADPVKIEFFKRNMYRGLGVSMGRSCAVNAIFFSTYEFLKKQIKVMDNHQASGLD